MIRHAYAGAMLCALCAASVACSTDDEKKKGPPGTGGTGGEPGVFEPAEAGIRRLLVPQYVSSVRYMLGNAAAEAVVASDLLPDDEAVSGYDAIGAAETPPQTNAPEFYDLAAQRVAEVAVSDPSTLALLAPCVVDGPFDDTCYEQVARRLGRVAFRRDVLDEERAWMVGLAQQASAWDGGNFDTGLEYMLRGILQSPSFLYIVEIGQPDPEDSTRRRLITYELATRLSFFLTNTTPDLELLDVAASGLLSDETKLRAQASRLLAKPEAVDTLRLRMRETLGLDGVLSAQKSAEFYPDFDEALRHSMIREVELLFEDLVWYENADIRTLFTADYTFVDANLAALYDVAPPSSGWERVTLPPEQERSGFLGSAAFLTRASHSVTSSPTRRGVFVLANLLCESVPPPAPEVATVLPQPQPGDAPKTTKQILEEHVTNEQCAGCHSVFDPYGFALEHFDAIGRYRETDSGLPIDTYGEVPNFGSFSSGPELAEMILADEEQRLSECIIRHVVRGALGHVETDGEQLAIDALEERFAEGGYRMQSLMIDMATSELFQYVASGE